MSAILIMSPSRFDYHVTKPPHNPFHTDSDEYSMDEASVKRRVSEIARMHEIASNEVDERAIGELKGLANELQRLSDDLSDSRLKDTVNSLVRYIVGGLAGYALQQLWISKSRRGTTMIFYILACLAAIAVAIGYTEADVHVLIIVLGVAVFAYVTRESPINLGYGYSTFILPLLGLVATGGAIFWTLSEQYLASIGGIMTLTVIVFVAIKMVPTGVRVLRMAFDRSRIIPEGDKNSTH